MRTKIYIRGFRLNEVDLPDPNLEDSDTEKDWKEDCSEEDKILGSMLTAKKRNPRSIYECITTEHATYSPNKKLKSETENSSTKFCHDSIEGISVSKASIKATWVERIRSNDSVSNSVEFKGESERSRFKIDI